MVEISSGLIGNNWIKVGLGSIAVGRWVCCSCGYSEEWIETDKLEKVKKYWHNAN